MIDVNPSITKIKVQNAVYFKEVIALLHSGKNVVIPVKGRSMFPLLRDGDKVRLEPANVDKLAVGQIVFGEYQGRFVLHRIIACSDRAVRIEGDNNLGQQEDIPVGTLYGTATKRYRNHKELVISTSFINFISSIWHKMIVVRKLMHRLNIKK